MWNRYGASELQQRPENNTLDFIVGKSAAVEEMKERILKVGRVDFAVLVQGESGTGKELVARGIHKISHRCGAAYIAVNSASIPDNLLEAELFGYRKGAFTGASSDRKGLIEAADGGSLFLDEVGELPLNLQAKLLRVLQEKEVRRVGDNNVRKVDFRLISATNRDLSYMVEQGSFREDLFYRIQDLQLKIPPLRERCGDIAVLADYFFDKHDFSPYRSEDRLKILNYLEEREYPGNIRELEAVIKRVITFYPELDLKEEMPGEVREGGLREAREEFERHYLRRRLDEYDWNRTRCAESLGITREYCWKLIKKYGLKR